MRIVIAGSVSLPVPPPMQGGTERVAWAQAIGLAGKGHDVTLIAAKGSAPSDKYKLVEIGGGDTVAGSAVSKSENSHEVEEFVESSRPLRKEFVYLTSVAHWLDIHHDEYDLILNNMRGAEVLFHLVAKKYNKKYASVSHLPIFKELADSFREFETPVITISNAQRKPFPDLAYAGTVYNGIDMVDFPFQPKPSDYLLMMGSVTPHKNQKTGISVAKALGMKFVIAGKVGNPAYYAKEIAPHVDGKTVIHRGEMGMAEKVALYGGAKALLFPVLWEEPFGLVMIEAMATGAPVVAYRRGAVAEVVVNDKTGFIVDNEVGMREAVGKIGTIDRAVTRKHVEDNFTNEKMVDALDTILQGL